MRQAFPDRICGPLEPVCVLSRLLSREKFHARIIERLVWISPVDVPVKRGGIELGQNEDAPET
jgi:hypothetical protein